MAWKLDPPPLLSYAAAFLPHGGVAPDGRLKGPAGAAAAGAAWAGGAAWAAAGAA